MQPRNGPARLIGGKSHLPKNELESHPLQSLADLLVSARESQVDLFCFVLEKLQGLEERLEDLERDKRVDDQSGE